MKSCMEISSNSLNILKYGAKFANSIGMFQSDDVSYCYVNVSKKLNL